MRLYKHCRKMGNNDTVLPRIYRGVCVLLRSLLFTSLVPTVSGVVIPVSLHFFQRLRGMKNVLPYVTPSCGAGKSYWRFFTQIRLP